MKKAIGILARVSFAAVCLATCAFATDFYVDAVHGDDAAGDGTAQNPWRTITHALAAIPAERPVPHTIQIRPGTYTVELGETFPLRPRPKIRLVGTKGAGVTILEAPGQTVLAYWTSPSSPLTFDASSGASGLTLRNGALGISMAANNAGDVSPSFSDLVIEGMSGEGVTARSTAFVLSSSGHVAPGLERVTIADCGTGITFGVGGSESGFASGSLNLSDCTIRHCATDGIRFGSGAGAFVRLQRCTILDNGADGVFGSATSYSFEVSVHISVTAASTLIAGNGGSGVRLETHGSARPTLDATYCTFANNVASGVLVSGVIAVNTRIMNSILCGNADDLSSPALFARSSNSEDGAMLGQPGCIAADAEFVDPANGDYRLHFESPCIDTGDAGYGDVPDLLGRTRMIDGDLDTLEQPDMGAIEFAPLFPLTISGDERTISMELWGLEGAGAILYASGEPLVATPEVTPFGKFFLAPGSGVEVAYTRTLFNAPNVITFKMGALPPSTLSTASFQALIHTPAAPQGGAFSNPIAFTLPP